MDSAYSPSRPHDQDDDEGAANNSWQGRTNLVFNTFRTHLNVLRASVAEKDEEHDRYLSRAATMASKNKRRTNNEISLTWTEKLLFSPDDQIIHEQDSTGSQLFDSKDEQQHQPQHEPQTYDFKDGVSTVSPDRLGDLSARSDDSSDQGTKVKRRKLSKKARDASMVGAFVTFSKALFGIGMLSNPAVLGEVGLILGTFCHLFIIVGCAFACYLLLMARQIAKQEVLLKQQQREMERKRWEDSTPLRTRMAVLLGRHPTGKTPSTPLRNTTGSEFASHATIEMAPERDEKTPRHGNRKVLNNTSVTDDYQLMTSSPPPPPPIDPMNSQTEPQHVRLVTYGDVVKYLAGERASIFIIFTIVTVHLMFASGMVHLAVENLCFAIGGNRVGWSVVEQQYLYDDDRANNFNYYHYTVNNDAYSSYQNGDDGGNNGNDDLYNYNADNGDQGGDGMEDGNGDANNNGDINNNGDGDGNGGNDGDNNNNNNGRLLNSRSESRSESEDREAQEAKEEQMYLQWEGASFTDRLTMAAMLFPIVLLLLEIPSLRDLATISSIGLLTYAFGCIGTMLYVSVVKTSGQPFKDRPEEMWTMKWSGIPIYVATTVYAIEGINLALPTVISVEGVQRVWERKKREIKEEGTLKSTSLDPEGGSRTVRPDVSVYIVCGAVFFYGFITLIVSWLGLAGGLGGGIGTIHEESGCPDVTYCLNSSSARLVYMLSLAVALILTLPVILFPSTEMLEIWLDERDEKRKKFAISRSGDIDPLQIDPPQTPQNDAEARRNLVKMIRSKSILQVKDDDTGDPTVRYDDESFVSPLSFTSESELRDVAAEGAYENIPIKDVTPKVEQRKSEAISPCDENEHPIKPKTSGRVRRVKYWKLRMLLAGSILVIGTIEGSIPQVLTVAQVIRGVGLSIVGLIFPPLLYMSAVGGNFGTPMATAMSLLVGLGLFNIVLVLISSFGGRKYVITEGANFNDVSSFYEIDWSKD